MTTKKEKPKSMTLANKITVLRIIAIPFFVICLLEGYVLWAQIIFAASVFSDALDGTLARLMRQRTPLGTVLDPMADKLLLLSAYIVLTYMGRLPLWVFVAVLSRDLLILMGWSLVFLLTSNKRVEPRPSGKVTTALQMAVALAVLFNIPAPFSSVLLHLMIAATCVSAFDYVWIGNRRLGSVEP